MKAQWPWSDSFKAPGSRSKISAALGPLEGELARVAAGELRAYDIRMLRYSNNWIAANIKSSYSSRVIVELSWKRALVCHCSIILLQPRVVHPNPVVVLGLEQYILHTCLRNLLAQIQRPPHRLLGRTANYRHVREAGSVKRLPGRTGHGYLFRPGKVQLLRHSSPGLRVRRDLRVRGGQSGRGRS